MKNMKYIAMLLLFIVSCDDANENTFSGRKTFMVFYESDQSLLGISAKEIEDGFIILSNKVSVSQTHGLLTKTDKSGNILWEEELPNAVFKSLAINADGYFAVGDSIKINASDTIPVSDLVISSLMLYKVNASGDIAGKLVITDDQSAQNFTDIRGNALNFNNTGQLIVLGTNEEGSVQATIKPFVAAFNPVSLEQTWKKDYTIITRDYINSKSVNTTATGHIVWASSILREQGDFSNSYLAIPYVKEESVFENNDLLGETTDQRYSAADIQPNASTAFGFGVVGSHAGTDGTNSNFFFCRVDNMGNIIQSSTKYFDGARGPQPDNDNPATASDSEDVGQAIAATQDGGYVLAGTMQTTPAIGNGGNDIMVLKLDANGNEVWRHFYGGSGDESVSTIVETSDGGLLLCGTRLLGGLGSAFILKLNRDGELKD